MKLPKVSRRKFIGLAFISLPASCLADTILVEPKWISISKISLNPKPTCRIVHFTDIHYKGDRPYLKEVVNRINDLSADFVCFTGDIVEDSFYLKESLELLRQIRSPVYGVPGNHDYWSGASFSEIAASFKTTGGAWLVDQQLTTADGAVTIFGSSGENAVVTEKTSSPKRILLTHYPNLVSKLKNETFDLILAGHSHGGQIRIPFWGSLKLPYGVGRYDKGLFQTSAGPLYVNAGIGTWYLPIRFCCRPEITIIEL